jgi:FkbM family methyltransferase
MTLFHRLLHRFMLSTRNGGLVNRGTFEVLDLVRGLMKRISDPLIPYDLEGASLLLPFSHELPFIRRAAPQYSGNVGRLARLVREKYSDMTMVDIGANVGDTVAIVRRLCRCPMLCIEGDARYFEILQSNIVRAGFDDVELACTFVGSETGSIRAVSVASGGTGRLVLDHDAAAPLKIKRLSDILADYPRFADFKLLKIDTDGYDCRILRGSVDLLARCRPVVFFEYDPHFLTQCSDKGIDVFECLRAAGYGPALVYENNGDYLLSTDLASDAMLLDLHQFYTGRHGQRYMDLCVFHQEDEDLCHRARAGEREYFDDFRSAA